jgi:hypothetical protein
MVASSSLILFNIILPASNETFSAWKGESPFAISSALTNSLQSNISGKIVNDAVVLPAPLQPAITYNFLSVTVANLQIYSV